MPPPQTFVRGGPGRVSAAAAAPAPAGGKTRAGFAGKGLGKGRGTKRHRYVNERGGERECVCVWTFCKRICLLPRFGLRFYAFFCHIQALPVARVLPDIQGKKSNLLTKLGLGGNRKILKDTIQGISE